MRGWWRARWAESRPDLPGRLDGRDKEPGGASRQPLREKSLRGRAGTSGGRGRGVDREFEAIRAAGPEGSLRRPGHGSSRRGVSPGSDGNSNGPLGTSRDRAARAPEAQDGVRQPRVGREFEAIRAAGPERSLRRVGPESSGPGVSSGSDGNSKRLARRARRNRSAAQARKLGTGESASGRTRIRGAFAAGPEGSLRRAGPGTPGETSQPCAGRAFETVAAASTQRRSRRRCSGRAATGSGSSSAARERTRAPQAIMA
jgi:hypothetical protein